MPAYYPIWLDIQGRRCVVVGGGKVAERKVAFLVKCRAEVVLISPDITPVIKSFSDQGEINVYLREYVEGDLKGAWLVFAATGEAQLNQEVAVSCRSLDIPVNVVDAPEAGSFVLPAVLRRGSLNIGVSTEGKSPLLAQKLRDALAEAIGPEYGEFVEWLGEQRKSIQSTEGDIEKRRLAYEEVLECLAFDFEGPRAGEYKERIKACISCYPE